MNEKSKKTMQFRKQNKKKNLAKCTIYKCRYTICIDIDLRRVN